MRTERTLPGPVSVDALCSRSTEGAQGQCDRAPTPQDSLRSWGPGRGGQAAARRLARRRIVARLLARARRCSARPRRPARPAPARPASTSAGSVAHSHANSRIWSFPFIARTAAYSSPGCQSRQPRPRPPGLAPGRSPVIPERGQSAGTLRRRRCATVRQVARRQSPGPRGSPARPGRDHRRTIRRHAGRPGARVVTLAARPPVRGHLEQLADDAPTAAPPSPTTPGGPRRRW